jgi:hypothetical protein
MGRDAAARTAGPAGARCQRIRCSVTPGSRPASFCCAETAGFSGRFRETDGLGRRLRGIGRSRQAPGEAAAPTSPSAEAAEGAAGSRALALYPPPKPPPPGGP